MWQLGQADTAKSGVRWFTKSVGAEGIEDFRSLLSKSWTLRQQDVWVRYCVFGENCHRTQSADCTVCYEVQ